MIMTRARRAELGFELVVTGADGAVDGLGGAFEEGAEVVEVVLVVEDEIRSLVVLQIQRCISNKFPDAKVRSFGSYETKLYLPLGFVFLLPSTAHSAFSHRV